MVQILISSLAIVAIFVVNFIPAIAVPTISILEMRDEV
jgi:hypothetical protein